MDLAAFSADLVSLREDAGCWLGHAGWSLECRLGHATFVCLTQRGLLLVFRAAYWFRRAVHASAAPLWPSVLREISAWKGPAPCRIEFELGAS